MKEDRKSMLPFYFRVFIALGYIVIGIIMLTTKAGLMMTGNKSFGFVFGIACLGYGAFRIYRARKRWDSPNYEE